MAIFINKSNVQINRSIIGLNDLEFFKYRILIDLGGDLNSSPAKTPISNPDSFGYYWNKFVGTGIYTGGTIVNGFYPGLTLNNICDTNNSNRGISMVLTTVFNSTFIGAGTTPALNGNGPTSTVGDYIGQATRDSMFSHIDTAPGRLTFNNLIPSKIYTFKFWGSRITGSLDNRFLELKKSTDAWASALNYNASENTTYTNAIVFTGITGVSTIAFDGRTRAGSTFGYIGIIDINVQ